MSKNYYILGEWNLICDVCGKKIKAHKAKHRWDGFIVCEEDYETRHPQDFVKARVDKITVPYIRPRPLESFLERYSFNDNIMASDMEYFNDYMLYDPTNLYFLEDYILDTKSFTITMKWNRPILDPVSVTEYCALSYKKPFTDSVTITENVMIGSIYRSTFTDTLTLADSGDIFQSTYVDGTYFSEQYVGTIYTF